MRRNILNVVIQEKYLWIIISADLNCLQLNFGLIKHAELLP